MKRHCRYPFGPFLLGLSLIAASSVPVELPPAFVTMWGSYCDTSVSGVDACDGRFWSPYGVAVNERGNVYVAESYNHRVQKFDSNGRFLTKWGSIGSGDGQFDLPLGIAVDASGDVYVVDSGNNRIQKFDGDGTFLTKWGSYGSGNDQLKAPTGVAVNAAGNVYVADQFNDRILRFSITGTYQIQWGTTCDTSVSGEDACDGNFDHPLHLAVDSSSNVYVSDAYNHRIQKFDSNGGFLARWGALCDTGASGVDGCDGKFGTPLGVSVDASDNVYVADYQNDRIQKFDSNGTFLTKWGTHSSGPGAAAGKFYQPAGVEVDDSDDIYVTDSANSRVQKFSPGLDFFIAEPDLLAKKHPAGAG